MPPKPDPIIRQTLDDFRQSNYTLFLTEEGGDNKPYDSRLTNIEWDGPGYYLNKNLEGNYSHINKKFLIEPTDYLPKSDPVQISYLPGVVHTEGVLDDDYKEWIMWLFFYQPTLIDVSGSIDSNTNSAVSYTHLTLPTT